MAQVTIELNTDNPNDIRKVFAMIAAIYQNLTGNSVVVKLKEELKEENK